MQEEKKKPGKNYLLLITKFWKEHRICHFTKNERVLYDTVLGTFNDMDWPEKLNATHSMFTQESELNYRALHEARKGLAKRGFLYYKSKAGSKKVVYSLDPFPGCMVFADEPEENDSDKPRSETDSGTDITPTPAPSSDRPLKKALSALLSDDPTPEAYKDTPPDDGIKRNYEGLQERLRKIKCPPDLFKTIVNWSNYGQSEHKIWEILDKIRDDKGLKMPLDFLKSRMQKAIAEGYVATPIYEVASSPSAPEPPAPDIADFRPPDDGAERDWDKLKSRLKELKCPPVAINRIAVLSGYGKIDNPVWEAVKEIRNKGDDIPQPGKWIIDYIRENTT